MKEPSPRLTVVARRLDGNAPLVWNGWANNAFIEGEGAAGMFMVTGVDISSSGCWERRPLSHKRPKRPDPDLHRVG
jgi:hypothetical protein